MANKNYQTSTVADFKYLISHVFFLGIGLPLLCQEHLLLFMHERFLSMQEAGADWQVQSKWKILGVFLEHWKV